ncbi:MAG: hydrogenase iron-sulfur subunit [Candidatus Bathyarchaeia archaeon]
MPSLHLCRCGGILPDVLDLYKLKEFSTRRSDVETCRIHDALCTPRGLEQLKAWVKKDKPSSVVVAACSKRLIGPLINAAISEAGLDPAFVEVVALREHCVWPHQEDGKKALIKAERMLSAAVERVKGARPAQRVKAKPFNEALVIGGGVAGIQAALELANKDVRVHLVENTPTIGGKMALLVKTYPTDDCAICILGPKMAEVRAHPNINLLTYSEVREVKRMPNGFRVTVEKKPRYVDFEKCTGCGMCAEKCPVKVENEWNGGLGFRKAIYIPYPQAVPKKCLIDTEHCLYFQKGICRVCEKVCPTNAPNFDDKPQLITLDVGAIIIATGFKEYNPAEEEKYGVKEGKGDVITQFQLARILDPSGPTQGKLVRISDGVKPKSVLMVQCVGSRDPTVFPDCSRYCTMAAIKHATLIKVEQDPEIDVTILYKDVRAGGKGFEEYYDRSKYRFQVNFVLGELIRVSRKPDGKMEVKYQNPETGDQDVLLSDMVVLSCGGRPSEGIDRLAKALGLALDKTGFFQEADGKIGVVESSVPGVYLAGYCQGPKDIPESVEQAWASALKAISHLKSLKERRTLNPEWVEVRCGGCGICAATCPQKAITIVEGKPQIDFLACWGCGVCVMACPNKALEIPSYSSRRLSLEIAAALSGRAGDSDSPIIAFCCGECVYTLLDNVGFHRKTYSAEFTPIFLPCVNMLSTEHVLYAIDRGAAGVLVLGCKVEESYLGEKAERLRARFKVLEKLMEDLGLNGKKLGVYCYAGGEVDKFLQDLEEFQHGLKGETSP